MQKGQFFLMIRGGGRLTLHPMTMATSPNCISSFSASSCCIECIFKYPFYLVTLFTVRCLRQTVSFTGMGMFVCFTHCYIPRT